MRIAFHSSGFRDLLTSAGAQELVQEQADKIAVRANATPSTTSPAHTEPYYEVAAEAVKRARAFVQTAGARAIVHEQKTGALTKALGGG